METPLEVTGRKVARFGFVICDILRLRFYISEAQLDGCVGGKYVRVKPETS